MSDSHYCNYHIVTILFVSFVLFILFISNLRVNDFEGAGFYTGPLKPVKQSYSFNNGIFFFIFRFYSFVFLIFKRRFF